MKASEILRPVNTVCNHPEINGKFEPFCDLSREVSLMIKTREYSQVYEYTKMIIHT